MLVRFLCDRAVSQVGSAWYGYNLKSGMRKGCLVLKLIPDQVVFYGEVG